MKLVISAVVMLVLAAALPAAAAEPQIVDRCGDVGTGVETDDDKYRVMVGQERDSAYDIASVAFSTVFDAADAPSAVAIALTTCADEIPAPETHSTAWRVRWDTPDNDLGEPCNATVIVNDAVRPPDVAGGIQRQASLYQVCSRPNAAPLGNVGASATAYTAFSVDISDRVSIDGGTITWTLPFADLETAAAILAPGVDMADPVASARDGRRATELWVENVGQLHVAAGDGTATGQTFTIGQR